MFIRKHFRIQVCSKLNSFCTWTHHRILWSELHFKAFRCKEKLPIKKWKRTQSILYRVFLRNYMLHYLGITDLLQNFHSHNDFHFQSMPFHHIPLRISFYIASKQIHRHPLPSCNRRLLWSLGGNRMGRERWTELSWNSFLLCITCLCSILGTSFDLPGR